MTTLPQTTNIRLPRPMGVGPMTVAGTASPLAHQAPAAAQSGMSGGDIWRVIRSNMWLIVIMVVVAALLGIGAFFYLLNFHPKYTAIGYVQVQAQNGFNPLGTRMKESVYDNTSVQLDQRTHAQLLKDYSLHTRVLQDPNAPIRNTTWFKQYLVKATQSDGTVREQLNDAEAKEDLQENFEAVPIQESRLIRVTMSYKEPRDCKVIVDNLVEVHLRDQRTILERRTNERAQTLNFLKNKYEGLIRQHRNDANLKLQRINQGGGGQTAFGMTPKDMEVARLLEHHVRLQAIHQETSSQLKSLKEQIQMGIRPPMVERMVDQDMSILRLKSQMDELEMALAGARSQGGDKHGYVRRLESQLDGSRKIYDDRYEEVAAKMQVLVLEQLEQATKTSQLDLETNTKQVQQIKEELADISTTRAEYMTLKDEEETYRELLKTVSDNLDTIQGNNQANSSGGIEWARQPATPDKPSFPQIAVVMSIAIGLGLALSLGIAFLREFLDTSVRSPRDIARVGQMNLLGTIPDEEDDPQVAGTPLPMVIFQAPHSLMAEQFRQVRTRLQHAASLDTTRSILVTSPGPGDGKTTVAVNLAAGLALNGRRILLVDCNFRRPEIHNVFGQTNDIGLGSVLNDVANFENAVRPTQVPNLEILTSGPRPANATELLESQALTDFIERALEEYDHVIFDSGPMLVVSETVALAPRVDGVVSVVRAKANSRGLLQRLRDSLRQLKAEHLGVVLNGVRAQAGGYYNRNIRAYYEYGNTVPATTTAVSTNGNGSVE